jgi:hypothetical protein
VTSYPIVDGRFSFGHFSKSRYTQNTNVHTKNTLEVCYQIKNQINTKLRNDLPQCSSKTKKNNRRISIQSGKGGGMNFTSFPRIASGVLFVWNKKMTWEVIKLVHRESRSQAVSHQTGV